MSLSELNISSRKYKVSVHQFIFLEMYLWIACKLKQPVNVVMKSMVVFLVLLGWFIEFVFIIQKLWVQMFKHAAKVIGHEISNRTLLKKRKKLSRNF